MKQIIADKFTPPPTIHSNNLKFLRIVFALLVILSHSPELIDGDRHRELLTRLFHTISFGEFAVNGFFILNGYLIVKSWQSRPVISDYLKKRFLRIVPGFAVAYLISTFIVGPLGATNVSAYFSHVKLGNIITHLSTLNGLPKILHTFSGLPHPYLNGSLWTIQYEFGCYLLVLALGSAGILKKRVPFIFLFLLSTGCYALAHHLESHLRPMGLFGLPLQWARLATFFLAGGCFCVYRERIAYRPQWAVLALIILVAALRLHQIQMVVLPLSQAYLLFYIGFFPVPLLAKIGTKVDLSYGLYLYAWPVQTLIIWHYRTINPWLLCVVTVVITSGLAWLSWHLVERPALSLKPRRPSAAPIAG